MAILGSSCGEIMLIDMLNRLRSDTSGNVAIIAAGALIPLMALIGGGVDTGRAYMAKTQLQAACDAGVLAGRRAMGESGEYADDEKAKAEKMFEFNFDADAVTATDVEFESVDNVEGQVTGTATATVPTVVMKIFGKETLDLTTQCMAELQIANADVMFVLDTTGSMGGTRIAGLRDAVRDFHKTMNGAIKDDNTRVRYGFVPYSMTVNAHDLVADGSMPTSYFRDDARYETRAAQFNKLSYFPTETDVITRETQERDFNSKDKCKAWASNYGDNPQILSGAPPGEVVEKYYQYRSYNRYSDECERRVEKRNVTYETRYLFTKWRYERMPLDTSSFKTLASETIATDISSAYSDVGSEEFYDLQELAEKNGSTLHDVGTATTTWNGCIEERDTVSSATWDPIPSDAYDLDLDSAPVSKETRWRPMWDDVAYSRNYQNSEETSSTYRGSAYAVCPAPMKLFTEVELSEDVENIPTWLDDYVDNLVAKGNTYHDIGMIWGGRLSSSRGIFADNVNKDDKSVSRHLIFMTDGKMEPSIGSYNAYGIEEITNFIAPEGSSTWTVTNRHTARFLAACEEVKAQGTTVWVIAFGTTLTNDMKTCSSSGRAYQSNDTDELKKTFKFIASQVANLRLGL